MLFRSRVCMNDLVFALLNDASQSQGGSQIKSILHGYFMERNGRIARKRESIRFDAGKFDFETMFGQLHGQQILNALGTRKVFAVDHVQDASRDNNLPRFLGDRHIVCDDRHLHIREVKARSGLIGGHTGL